MRTLTVKKAMAPRSVALSGQNSLFVGSFVKVDCSQPETAFAFLSEHISLQVCDRQHGNEFFLKHYGVILKPVLDIQLCPRKFVTHRLTLVGQADLQFEGLGFICFYGNTKAARQVEVDLPQGVGIAVRPSIVRTGLEAVPAARRSYVPKTRIIKQLSK